MANYVDIGGVPISGFISPGTTSDTFPVIDTTLGIDGLRNYTGGTEIFSGTTITELRRRAGMIVGIESGSRYFKLKDKDPWDFDETDWEEVNFGGGSGSAITGGTFSAGTLTLVNGSGDTINISGFTSGGTSLSAYTYSPTNNTFTIGISGETSLEAQINEMSGLTINGDLNVNGNSIFSGDSTNVVKIFGSGDTSPLISIEGSSGELFTVTDSLSGELFGVNNVSGIPIFEVYDDNTILMGNNQAPSLNTTTFNNINAGQTKIYGLPLLFSNGAFIDYVVKNSAGMRAGSIMAVYGYDTTSVYGDWNETTTNDIGDTSGVTFELDISGTSVDLLVSATTNNWEIKTIIRSI